MNLYIVKNFVLNIKYVMTNFESVDKQKCNKIMTKILLTKCFDKCLNTEELWVKSSLMNSQKYQTVLKRLYYFDVWLVRLTRCALAAEHGHKHCEVFCSPGQPLYTLNIHSCNKNNFLIKVFLMPASVV
jgi:hypothetical protein